MSGGISGARMELSGFLLRYNRDIPKRRFLVLTHGALYEYMDQGMSKLRVACVCLPCLV